MPGTCLRGSHFRGYGTCSTLNAVNRQHQTPNDIGSKDEVVKGIPLSYQNSRMTVRHQPRTLKDQS
jgi:hypothetical protein